MAILGSEVTQPPIDAICYPFGGREVSRIFQELGASEMGVDDLRQEQEGIMLDDNPFALKYLIDVSEQHSGPPYVSRFFRYGTSLMYKVLQNRFGDTPVPKLTGEFINDFKDMHERHIVETYGVSFPQYTAEQSEREQIQRVNMFKFLEPKCFDDLVENVLGTPEELLKKNPKKDTTNVFSDPLIAGFVFSYFLFRTGISNPESYKVSIPGK